MNEARTTKCNVGSWPRAWSRIIKLAIKDIAGTIMNFKYGLLRIVTMFSALG